MTGMTRRELLKSAGVAAVAATAPALLAACAPKTASQTSEVTAPVSTPDGPPIKIGFIPLTDCSSVVMAHELGLYKKYGVNVELSREASWANVRDKLLTGELAGAHCLFGMPFSVYTGVG
ncbi:MAG: nitrate/nitrite transport system substrate-binding protein, partial [Chloroflexota bacterium]|nr:nitrate/nitrite transport system substrate-binding protein [Chloroflexota bacterium]